MEEEVPTKTTYWVRSKQPNEISGFSRRPVPAQFINLDDAKEYRRELNLRRGPYHPGYIIEEQSSAPIFPFKFAARGDWR
jgi:hypothetical protein